MSKKTTKELEKIYGTSAKKTEMFEGKAILGKIYPGLDNKERKLIHIEVRNMLVDLWRFDDGLEVFTGDLDKHFDKKVFQL